MSPNREDYYDGFLKYFASGGQFIELSHSISFLGQTPFPLGGCSLYCGPVPTLSHLMVKDTEVRILGYFPLMYCEKLSSRANWFRV